MGDLVPVKAVGHVGTIEDNLDAVEVSIREKVKEYSAVVITENTIADGQKFRASINKEKKTLDDERKAIKQEWMKPYNDFEKRAKEIIALYDEPLKIIDSQLNEFEEQRKKEKRQEIKLAYDAAKGDMEDWLPLERIYNPKWENKTCTVKAVREEIEEDFARIQMYIDTVKSTGSEFTDDALDVLKQTGDLQTALETIHNLQTMKDRLAEKEEQERLKAEQERLKAEQEVIKAQQNANEASENAAKAEQTAAKQNIMEFPQEQMEEDPDAIFAAQAAQDAEELPFPVEDERIYTVTIKAAESRISALREMLDAAGFEYEVI